MKVAREDLRGNLFQRSYIVYRRAATQIRRRFWVVHAGTLSTTQKRSRDRLPGLSFFLLARPRIRIIESRSTTPRDLALHLPAKDPHSLPRFHISFTVHCASFRPDGDVFYDSRSGRMSFSFSLVAIEEHDRVFGTGSLYGMSRWKVWRRAWRRYSLFVMLFF